MQRKILNHILDGSIMSVTMSAIESADFSLIMELIGGQQQSGSLIVITALDDF